MNTKPVPTHHLSETELEDFLIGEGSAESRAHLLGCAACRLQVEQFQSALDVFNHSTLAWAQARSNTLPRDLAASRPASHWGFPGAWSAAAAACCAAILAAGVAWHHPAAPPAEAAAPPATPQVVAVSLDRSHEIAQDNALMSAIDSAIYARVDSPSQLYADAPGSGPRTRRRQIQERN